MNDLKVDIYKVHNCVTDSVRTSVWSFAWDCTHELVFNCIDPIVCDIYVYADEYIENLNK